MEPFSSRITIGHKCSLKMFVLPGKLYSFLSIDGGEEWFTGTADRVHASPMQNSLYGTLTGLWWDLHINEVKKMIGCTNYSYFELMSLRLLLVCFHHGVKHY